MKPTTHWNGVQRGSQRRLAGIRRGALYDQSEKGHGRLRWGNGSHPFKPSRD